MAVVYICSTTHRLDFYYGESKFRVSLHKELSENRNTSRNHVLYYHFRSSWPVRDNVDPPDHSISYANSPNTTCQSISSCSLNVVILTKG